MRCQTAIRRDVAVGNGLVGNEAHYRRPAPNVFSNPFDDKLTTTSAEKLLMDLDSSVFAEREKALE